ncbi:Imm47 family immunity protein [Paenibacillus sp. FSL R7-0179]|uniref:Imm47 family immunity protein n=1 Tax=Paenibacillus sp. FSL R7-0179 TaxID=2921672 RepID=UPI0030F92161
MAAHKDLLNSEDLLFLSNLSELNANTFAASAVSTLSYDAIPYLLAMLEEWEDTSVEGTIRNSLDIFLDYSEELSEDATVDEIGHFYMDFIKSVDPENYYYFGEPVLPGVIAKKIIEKSVISLNQSTPVLTNVYPSLLSVWSGVRCPVQYGTIVDAELLKDVYGYVDEISKMDWEVGAKYFYGNRVR